MNRDELFEYAREAFGVAPEYLWQRYPNYAVLRHSENDKWFALIADVSKAKQGIAGEGRIDFLVDKEDPGIIAQLIQREGFYPAYHMSKKNWISLALDGRIADEEIMRMLNTSFQLTR